ncbi:hypothetical protein FJQ98_01635 [Lysinibacillus agricola]|uniref:Lipoprotein n=1 Tax=Lysinibacillus agricola TaxID=2590012 RepID=A0ABX7ASM5_9BACI|nr:MULTISPECIES: hypothetical protein [Lysinibacillus]KOS61337.1 hypothetical protein AN161_18865 [Lysinibacillus sp. FJAT-14222]QQP12819.1 hypothetical protein FJQ98_01635 [Lysinibacillus agricola]
MKQILLLVTLVLLMSGCVDGDKYSFSESGDNWEILYEVVVTNDVEQQTAGSIKYIGDNKAPETIDYKIQYNSLGQGSSDEESPLKFGAVKFKNITCGNCEIIQKDDEIEVEIMWEGQTEKLILTTDK